ncbi:MAG TPA: protein phosphatase 2C domain-containing protein [Alphaproteobacteria bacterium]|jgi:serine/threonine protein phosphatase PrpC
MKIERGYAQHVGSRNEQQDAGLVLTDAGHSEQLVLVADGMGGHAGGSLASTQVAETARRIWGEHQKTPIEPKRLLERIIREGHEAINRVGAEKGLTPRSTCVLLYLRNGGVHWAHVGDSRIYRLRDGQVSRLTRDHSVVQMLVDLGKLSEDEMGTHPDQNRLTQSLGGDAQPMPDFGNDTVRPHDAFLVCSDGLWEMIPQSEMAAALAAKKLGDDGAKHLADRAFDRAKPKSDNITVAMLRIDGPPPGGISAEIDDARTTRIPDAMQRRAAGGARWGFVAATVVALGAAAAAVYKPWNKDGLDPGPTPTLGPTDKPAEKAAPPQQERRAEPPKTESPNPESPKLESPKPESPRSESPKSEPPKSESPKSEPAKPDGEPKPADRREAPPADKGPEATPPQKEQPTPGSAPPGEPAQPKPSDDQGKTPPPKTEPPASGGAPEKKQAVPRHAPPRPAQPATPRQSGLGPDEKKKGTEPPSNNDKPANTEKPGDPQPQGPAPEAKPQ